MEGPTKKENEDKSLDKKINEIVANATKDLIKKVQDLSYSNDILFKMVDKQKKMIEILQIYNSQTQGELNETKINQKNILLEHKSTLLDHKKLLEDIKGNVDSLNQKNEDNEKEIRKLNAKINLFSYRDSVKKFLYKLLYDSDSNLKNQSNYSYDKMGNEIVDFIKSEKFEKIYFPDENGTFTKFVKNVCSFMHSANMEIHDGNINYNYSFEDFINSFNLCCSDYGLNNIIDVEKNELINYMKKFNMYNYFN